MQSTWKQRLHAPSDPSVLIAVLVTWDPDEDRGEAETVMWLVLHPDK